MQPSGISQARALPGRCKGAETLFFTATRHTPICFTVHLCQIGVLNVQTSQVVLN